VFATPADCVCSKEELASNDNTAACRPDQLRLLFVAQTNVGDMMTCVKEERITETRDGRT